MTNNKNNSNELVDDYCQIDNRPASDTPSDRSPEFASDKCLTTQLTKCDAYADQLRWQIRDLQATVDAQSEQLCEVRRDFDTKLEQLTKEKTSLASARRTISELRQRNELAEKRHSQEILALQVQLENTDNSFDDANIQTQELAQQLLLLRESRESLKCESHKRHIKTERRINALKTKCKKIARQKAEYKKQINAKNKAIHGLLSQIGSKSSALDNESDSDGTVQVIDYSLYGPLEYEPDDDGSMESVDKPNSADELYKRELIGRIDGSPLRFLLSKDRLTIGRTIENDIQLTPSYISRHHATIFTKDGTTRVVDSGSKNGVFVNYKRVKEHSLSDGDVVAVGFAKFIYREQPQIAM